MNRRERRAAIGPAGREKRGRRPAVMSGLVAIAATGALAGPAQAATKIFACYSDTTDAMSFLPNGANPCPSGETKISWAQQGPQGARGINWRGGWSATLSYAVGDAVAYQGSSWYAKVANTNSAPSTSNTNWAVLALKGSQGAQGAKGAQGTQGVQGARGAQGVQGARGTQGSQGSRGPQGTTGPQGAVGVPGSQGSPGPQGSQGPQGAQGAQGADGAVSGIGYEHSSFRQSLTPTLTTFGQVAPGLNSPAIYTVTATATVYGRRSGSYTPGPVICVLSTVTSHGSPSNGTQSASAELHSRSDMTTLTETGVLPVPANGIIRQRCRGYGTQVMGKVNMSLTRVATGVIGSSPRPRHTFTPKRGVARHGSAPRLKR